MTRPRCRGRVLVAVCALAAAPLMAQEHRHATGPAGEQLGRVHFQTSCREAAQPAFDRAMALLHSFEFGQAIDGFNATLKADPACAMAHWGIALARWGNPFAPIIRPPAQLAQGRASIRQAEQAGPKTPRERAYVAAASTLYAEADTLDQRARLIAYEKAMADLAAAYRDDREASLFWALALTASAPPTDKTYANQLRAGEILEKLLPEQPDHPGVAHYIIHSYDVPPLASRALEAARRYAKIAPSAPHALHMPSHTFTRVGAWRDSIETNIASVEAARRLGSVTEELHAMDYMAYAYLQTGQDAAVQRLIEALPALQTRLGSNPPAAAAPLPAGSFAAAAIPARQALEHRDWSAAARIVPRATSVPYADALSHFARALGSARAGAVGDAKAAIEALASTSAKLQAAGESYWAEQVDIQRETAAAFVALAEGRQADALAAIRRAAGREDATEKNAITPGPLLPARELLGDMLLELKRPAEALEAFQATMKKEPNRFRAIYGAARAASATGDAAAARTYYAQLLEICAPADQPGRVELREARAALGK